MDPFDVFVRFVLYFTIFAVMGYFVEAVNSLLRKGSLSNRGFLFGPYLPIYGFAAVIMVVILQNLPSDNLWLIFLSAMVMGAMLEYATSFLLEKIFHLRWWDYSKSDKLNLNGRICLRNSIAFGIVGCLFKFLLLPAANNAIDLMPKWLQITIAFVMLVVYAIDLVASSYANMKVKNMAEIGKAIGDQTSEIKKNAKKVIKEMFATPEKIAKRIERTRRKAERETQRRTKKNQRKH